MKIYGNNLRSEIRAFRKKKPFYAIPVILIGLMGLVLPVIPGILLLVMGFSLIFPKIREQKSV